MSIRLTSGKRLHECQVSGRSDKEHGIDKRFLSELEPLLRMRHGDPPYPSLGISYPDFKRIEESISSFAIVDGLLAKDRDGCERCWVMIRARANACITCLKHSI